MLPFCSRVLLVLGFCAVLPVAVANDAKSLFDQFHNRIYQIRLIERASNNKSALGSGFQITPDGVLATNFHVVSDAVHNTAEYRLEYVNDRKETGALKILDIDVISDLALVKYELPTETAAPAVENASRKSAYMSLAAHSPQQGEGIYSLGNPHDLGMTVVPGTHNGLVAHSFYERMLFSGSINPGMSGGPALNAAGEVIGVNVATAGNQLSFLVPVEKLRLLLQQYQQSHPEVSVDLKARIRQQLLENQKRQFSALLSAKWPTTKLGSATVMGEMTHYIRCWSVPETNTRLRLQRVQSSCTNDDYIFLSSRFSTGSIEYEFEWLETTELNPLQFYNAYKSNVKGALPANNAGEENVTEYKCNEDFVDQLDTAGKSVISKAVLCARQYKAYPGLYDLLYISAVAQDNHKGLISHFTLAGVDKTLGIQFARKFMEQVKWVSSSK